MRRFVAEHLTFAPAGAGLDGSLSEYFRQRVPTEARVDGGQAPWVLFRTYESEQTERVDAVFEPAPEFWIDTAWAVISTSRARPLTFISPARIRACSNRSRVGCARLLKSTPRRSASSAPMSGRAGSGGFGRQVSMSPPPQVDSGNVGPILTITRSSVIVKPKLMD